MLEEKDEKTGKPILDKDGKPKKKEVTFEKTILAYYAISKEIAALDDERLNSLVKYHADNFLAVQEEAERKSTPRPQHLCVLDVVPDAMGTGRQIVVPKSEAAKHPEPAKKNNIAQSPDLNFVPDIEPIDVKKVS